jgi:hypothetical protein
MCGAFAVLTHHFALNIKRILPALYQALISQVWGQLVYDSLYIHAT